MYMLLPLLRKNTCLIRKQILVTRYLRLKVTRREDLQNLRIYVFVCGA